MKTETKRVVVQTALTQQNMVPVNYACGDMWNTMPFVLLADRATIIFKLVTAGEGFYRCEVVLRDDDLEARVEKLEAALREIVESTDPYHHLTSVNVARRALDDA